MQVIHKRIRVYLLIPEPKSLRSDIDYSEIREEVFASISHILEHPIYGKKAREFVEEDFSRLLREPPAPPDLPEGFTKQLIDAHNFAVKKLYRFYKPSTEYSIMVRVPAEEGILSAVDAEIKTFIEMASKSKNQFDLAIQLVSKIVELGLVAGVEIWPGDVIEDLRTVFLGAGLDPRELKEYYSFRRTAP